MRTDLLLHSFDSFDVHIHSSVPCYVINLSKISFGSSKNCIIWQLDIHDFANSIFKTTRPRDSPEMVWRDIGQSQEF